MSELNPLTSYDKIRQFLIHEATDKLVNTADEIQAEWERLQDSSPECDYLSDAKEEFRSCGQRSEIPSSRWSRHYENEDLTREMMDGSYVCWTYWYGGGKHGCPEEMDWMHDAYPVEMKEETRVVKVFSRAPVELEKE